MNLNKFSEKSGDYDYVELTRNLVVRITPLRYKLITKSVRTWNFKHRYPYGISPNGYAYRCGCSHDCCGCLCREQMSVNFNCLGKDLYSVEINYYASYNY